MFEIDMKSRKSIYEQVTDRLKEFILTGVLEPGAKLPSVRELSKQLTVNPNTVMKAYRELERQSYIYTVSGVGSFAGAPEDILPDERKIAEIKSEISEDIRELYYLMRDKERIRLEICGLIDAMDEAHEVRIKEGEKGGTK